MGKSQSESSLLLLPPLKLRGAGGVMNPERGISKDSPRGRQQCLARAKKPLFFVIARSAATKQSQEGQPEMRQA